MVLGCQIQMIALSLSRCQMCFLLLMIANALPKQLNSSKDQDDQYQSRSSRSARDNHPDQVLAEPDQRYWQNTYQ